MFPKKCLRYPSSQLLGAPKLDGIGLVQSIYTMMRV